MLDNETLAFAREVKDRLLSANHTIATAESCTGGLIAAALTSVAGSSAVFYGGFVTYANDAKTDMIGVPAGLIAEHGAVSEAVARAMAIGCRQTARVDAALSVTGIAGPGGGSDAKPVGLVHFGLATSTGVLHREERFGDIGRDATRQASVRLALQMILGAYAP